MFNKRNEEAIAYLAAIVESSNDAIISKDLNGIIKTWNKSAERLFGYKENEVRGRSIKIIVPTRLLEEENQIQHKLRQGERIEHYETIRCDRWGKEIDISLTISPLRNRKGRVIGASKIARDISEHKRLEKKLQEMNERKNEFLAILAHELRNPLTAIHSGLQLFRSADLDEATTREIFEIIERQTQHINHLVEDLTDITRINQGKILLHKVPLKLQQAICLVLESCREPLQSKHHQLQLDLPKEPIIILGDLTRIAQIIINLLSNAIKYTPPQGEIVISAGQTNTEAFIKVQDNGIGIPPEMLDKVFEMFRRVENESSLSVDGLGVGLGIAKKLAEMHGGKIIPTNTQAGCEFIISFPLMESSASETSSNAEQPQRTFDDSAVFSA